MGKLIATSAFGTMWVRYNLMFQHPSDWHNNTGVIRQAEEQGMGIILMRPLASGVFQHLMAEAFPEIDVLDVGRLLLNYGLSDPYADVALVGGHEARGHGACLGEPRFVARCQALAPRDLG
jgi:predicted aldo/keto reductase-like oxidoreductase